METGIYHYGMPDYARGGYSSHRMPVEILSESAKSYRVKFLEYHAAGHRPGYVTWVVKRKVIITSRTAVSDSGTNNITHPTVESIRLPYKD